MDAGILATAAGTYAAANLDDFVALTALFALDRATGARNTLRIWAGQIIGIGLLTAAALLAAKALKDQADRRADLLKEVPTTTVAGTSRCSSDPSGESPGGGDNAVIQEWRDFIESLPDRADPRRWPHRSN